MLKFIQLLKTLAELLPVLIMIVKAVEEAIPGRGVGEQKLAMVRGMLESAYEVTNAASSIPFAEFWKLAEPAINSAVALFKRTGEFKAGPAAPATPAT